MDFSTEWNIILARGDGLKLEYFNDGFESNKLSFLLLKF